MTWLPLDRQPLFNGFTAGHATGVHHLAIAHDAVAHDVAQLFDLLQVDGDASGFRHLVDQRDGAFAVGATRSEYLDVHDLLLFHFEIGEIGDLRWPHIDVFERDGVA
jgi:hypothetical protein